MIPKIEATIIDLKEQTERIDRLLNKNQNDSSLKEHALQQVRRIMQELGVISRQIEEEKQWLAKQIDALEKIIPEKRKLPSIPKAPPTKKQRTDQGSPVSIQTSQPGNFFDIKLTICVTYPIRQLCCGKDGEIYLLKKNISKGQPLLEIWKNGHCMQLPSKSYGDAREFLIHGDSRVLLYKCGTVELYSSQGPEENIPLRKKDVTAEPELKEAKKLTIAKGFILIGLKTGGIVAFDQKTLRKRFSDYKFKSPITALNGNTNHAIVGCDNGDVFSMDKNFCFQKIMTLTSQVTALALQEATLFVGDKNGFVKKYCLERNAILSEPLLGFGKMVGFILEKDGFFVAAEKSLCFYSTETGSCLVKMENFKGNISAIARYEGGIVLGTKEGNVYQIDFTVV